MVLRRLERITIGYVNPTNDAKTVFGRRVRLARKARGLTLEALGKAADIGFKHIGEIERGEKAPSFEAVDRLVDALQVPLHELFSPFQPADTKAELRQLMQEVTAHGSDMSKRLLYVLLTLVSNIDKSMTAEAQATLADVIESRLLVVPLAETRPKKR
jgi:transcriptional regulator with XRE-family HTH domain